MSVNYALVEALIKARLAGAGEGAATKLQDKLSQAGSGRQHAGQPNPSSLPDEYPALQTGDLAASISSQPGSGLSVEVGALNNPPPEALSLILKPPSQGGRDWLTRAFHDPEVQQAARDGAHHL